MIEYEAKVLDVDEAAMRARLEALGAVLILDDITYIEGYDTIDDRHGIQTAMTSTFEQRFTPIMEEIRSLSPEADMFSQGAYLRLRREGDRHELIFKHSTPSTQRVKSEVEVSEAILSTEWADVAAWLGSMGLHRIVLQEKKRVSYALPPYRFDIDTWPGVPTYVEVESDSPESVLSGVEMIGADPSDALAISGAAVFDLYGITNPRRLLFSEVDNG